MMERYLFQWKFWNDARLSTASHALVVEAVSYDTAVSKFLKQHNGEKIAWFRVNAFFEKK